MALLLTSASNVWLCLRLANEQRGCQSNCIIGLSITRQLEKNFNSIFFKSEVCSRDLDLNLRLCDKSGTGWMLNISWRWLVLMRQKYSDFQDNANLFQLSSGTDCPASRFKKALYNTSQWFVAIIRKLHCLASQGVGALLKAICNVYWQIIVLQHDDEVVFNAFECRAHVYSGRERDRREQAAG